MWVSRVGEGIWLLWDLWRQGLLWLGKEGVKGGNEIWVEVTKFDRVGVKIGIGCHNVIKIKWVLLDKFTRSTVVSIIGLIQRDIDLGCGQTRVIL